MAKILITAFVRSLETSRAGIVTHTDPLRKVCIVQLTNGEILRGVSYVELRNHYSVITKDDLNEEEREVLYGIEVY
jgi:hypothetical protein